MDETENKIRGEVRDMLNLHSTDFVQCGVRWSIGNKNSEKAGGGDGDGT